MCETPNERRTEAVVGVTLRPRAGKHSRLGDNRCLPISIEPRIASFQQIS